MKLDRRMLLVAIVLIGLLAGSLAVGTIISRGPLAAKAAPVLQQGDGDGEQQDDGSDAGENEKDTPNEAEDGDQQDANENEAQDTSDEVAPASTGITAEQAQAIVEKANPGVGVLAVEFDRENGKDIFEVELANGNDVAVDASTGDILHTEVRD